MLGTCGAQSDTHPTFSFDKDTMGDCGVLGKEWKVEET